MARRNKYMSEQGDSTDDFDLDSNLSDAPGDDTLAGPSRKRKRRTREQAIYGVFGDSDQDNEAQGGIGRTVRGTDQRGKRVDYRAGQLFVPSSGLHGRIQEESKDKLRQDSNSDNESDSSSSVEQLSRQRVTEQEATETRPAFAGLGLAPTQIEAEMQREQETAEFRPASFVSFRRESDHRSSEGEPPKLGLGSRAGIGSRSVAASGNGNTPSQADSSARRGIGSSSQAKGLRSGLTSMSMFVSAGTSKPSEANLTSQSIENDPVSLIPNEDKDENVSDQMSAAGVPASFSTSTPAIQPSNAFRRRDQQHDENFTFSKPGMKLSTGPGKFDPLAYLAKMGWTGGGLGKDGHGIVNPIEVQLRPERAGIAYGGLKEKTKQAKQEARRRGEAVSSDEEDRAKRRFDEKRRVREERKAGKLLSVEQAAWTKAEKKPRKPKIEHRTYEQIIEEIGGRPSTHASMGKIIDATGEEMREVSDLASALANKGVPSVQTTHLPELLHNLRLICDENTQTLTALAREGAQILEKRKWLRREADEASRRRTAELIQIERVQAVLVLVQNLESLGTKLDIQGEADQLDSVNPIVTHICSDFSDQIEEFRLDEAVIGAVTPLLQKLWKSWKPLHDSRYTLSYFLTWQPGFTVQSTLTSKQRRGTMTAYESLMWNVWMPRVRSALNNEWKVHHPSAAVEVLEAWKEVLPRFVYDNVVDQLLLPKLRAGVSDYDPKTAAYGLEHIVFPWLSVLGPERLSEVLQEAKRRLRSSLKLCDVSKPPPSGLSQWRKLYQSGSSAGSSSSSDWDGLMLSTIVPKISALLRVKLVIEPEPTSREAVPILDNLLSWRSVLRRSILTRMLATEFFPIWLKMLHGWLRSPHTNLRDVVGWYQHWRKWFTQLHSSESDADPVLDSGFLAGLNLMNAALDLGASQRHLVEYPHFDLPSRRHPIPDLPQTPSDSASHQSSAETLTFRTALEAELSDHNLFLLKTPHVKSLGPISTVNIYRVSSTFAGTGTAGAGTSALIYIDDDDVVFLKPRVGDDTEDWPPVSVASLIAQLTSSTA